MHGLLQTREYAEALIRHGAKERTPEIQIAKWTDLRIERQRVLHQEDPTRLAIVLEEAAVQRPVGGEQIMRAQLRRLVDLGGAGNIEIQVIPTGYGPHAALRGSFQLYEMPDPYPDVAHMETMGGSLYLEEPTVSHIREVWKDLIESALSPEESIALVTRHMEGTA